MRTKKSPIFFEVNLSFFTFDPYMNRHIAHIATLFLITIFIIRGLHSALPFLSVHFFQHDTMEALAETETENTGEQSKVTERELISEGKHVFEFQLWAANNNSKRQYHYTARWQNAFVPIFTPPPEQA
ncbi:MAG: hypothetical protein KF862_24150 [Chitinophagaceae bacterium]|nr:hypothetical protein [Chitinophagaceae bacterium]